MSYTITAYTTEVFQEFSLPAVDNADHTIVFSAERFGLKNDVALMMDVINGCWRILPSKHYTVRSRGVNYFEYRLENSDAISLLVAGGMLSLVISRRPNTLDPGLIYDISDISSISIGRDKSCTICYQELELVSGSHAQIVKSGNEYILKDSSRNGTYLNECRVKEPVVLRFGDVVRIFGLTIIFLENIINVQSVCPFRVNDAVRMRLADPDQYRSAPLKSSRKSMFDDAVEHYHRPPRGMVQLYSETIEIDSPPERHSSEKKPLAMIIGPSFTMAIPMLLGTSFMIYARSRADQGGGNAFMYIGLITAVTSAIIGIIWALVNISYTEKKEREEELLLFEAYGDYLYETAQEIGRRYEHNRSAQLQQYPSAEVCARYTTESNLLWSRNRSHSDFLFHRLGTGDVPFQTPIKIAKKKLTLKLDNLSLKPKIIHDSYRTLTGVPVGIDLARHMLIGILSDSIPGAMDVMRVLVAQIAANNCYSEVKTVFVFDSEKCDSESWDFARWLPHTWSDDHEMRFVASNEREKSDVLYEITRILRTRAEESEAGKRVRNLPHYVIFLSSASLIDDELISKYLLDPRESYGVSTVILANHLEDLPNNCEHVIKNMEGQQEIWNTDGSSEHISNISFDYIEPSLLDSFVRSLCGVTVAEVEASGNIPASLTFFDMMGVNSPEELNVIERWKKNRTYDTLRACVGQKSGGVDCYIDIHEKHHGPHGLVAGTTGSGKSETLQTYILSLAVNYSPYDVAFFIIDYKGGGMANLFSNLPHMIGQISNLSGNQVRRSMVSIKSENKRRQKIFSEYGVNHINAYTKLLKNNEAKEPIPHLFIIIDEFAELKREEPDFMRELISVAQVGRSLGVHLILSTQKPSGTVDDNIWSNSKMRLCLRVQDKQDSMDMLHKPDAAQITNAGRCYLQVGNDELYELFQSGWSGAVYDSDAVAERRVTARMVELTGRSMLVGNKVKKKRKESSRSKWLGAMIDCVLLATSSCGISISDARSNASSMERLARETITVAEQYQMDYPCSDYNVHRLEDMLHLCPEHMEDYDHRELIRFLLDEAVRTGRRLPERKEKTQLEVTVDSLAQVADHNGYVNKIQLWMPVLPEMLYLDELSGFSGDRFDGSDWKIDKNDHDLVAPVGMIDDPVNQSQFPLMLNFIQNGHCAVCGTVSSGKSTFMQTLVYSLITRYTPDRVNIYIADYSSHSLMCFDDAPHVGGIVSDEDSDRVEKLFNMLIRELGERKRLISGGSYSQHITSKGNDLPAMLVMIDGYANFREKTGDAYEDALIRLSREGIGYGIYLVISSGGFGGADIQHRIGDNIKTSICLEMGDKFKYCDALHTMRIDVLPESGIKGRGLTMYAGTVLEYQTALSVRAEDDYGRIEQLQKECLEMRRAWDGSPATPIPFIPEKPVWSEFSLLPEYTKRCRENRWLPFGYIKETAGVCSVDLSGCYCYSIAGKSKTGKTDCLTNMIRAAAEKDSRVVVIDTNRGELKRVCDDVNGEYVLELRDLFNFWLEMATQVLPQRNAVKKQMLADGASDADIFEHQSQTQPVFIFVADLCEFIDLVYNHDKSVGNMSDCIENLIEKGSMNNVYVIGCLNLDTVAKVSVRKLYSDFVSDGNGILLGGNLAAQRMFTFSNIPYAEQSRSQKPGQGYMPDPEDRSVGIRIVLPHSRG